MTAAAINTSKFDESLYHLAADCVHDPYKFAMTFFPWGKGALAGKQLDTWQVEWLKQWGEQLRSGKKISIRQATKSGHGVGKSVMVSIAILFCMTTRPGFNGVCTAGTDTQLKSKTWRELKIWMDRAINKHWFIWTKTKIGHVSDPEKWACRAIPWSDTNPDAFQGLHGDYVGVFFDEASSISPIIWEVVEGAMTTVNSLWFAFGNPTVPEGRFYDCFYKDDRWQRFTVNSEDAFYVNREELYSMEKFYGRHSDTYRVRVLGEFPQNGSMLLYPRSLVMDAVERDIAKDVNQPRIMAVDVARRGQDLSGFGFRQGLWAGDWKMTPEPDTMRFADIIHEAALEVRPDHILIDADGVGGPVYDRLKQLGNNNVIEVHGNAAPDDETRHLNLRAQMYDRDVREHLRRGRIPNHQKLIDDLLLQQRAEAREGKRGDVVRLVPKNQLSESPDASDVLAYTYAQKFVPKDIHKQRLIDMAYANRIQQSSNYNIYEALG